jgi:hypothetical protein
MKKLIKRLLFGPEPTGETIDLNPSGRLRVQSTCEPEEKLGFNEFWQRVADLNRAAKF